MVRVEVTDGAAVVATVTIDGCVPDLFVVDVVARLELAARRLGWWVVVPAGAAGELCELAGLRGELGRQPERREQPGVEEVVQAGQPPV